MVPLVNYTKKNQFTPSVIAKQVWRTAGRSLSTRESGGLATDQQKWPIWETAWPSVSILKLSSPICLTEFKSHKIINNYSSFYDLHYLKFVTKSGTEDTIKEVYVNTTRITCLPLGQPTIQLNYDEGLFLTQTVFATGSKIFFFLT